jgi:hypothetical protein
VVQQLAVSAERCISQQAERGCNDMGSKCSWAAADGAAGRGLHSSTSQLSLSQF